MHPDGEIQVERLRSLRRSAQQFEPAPELPTTSPGERLLHASEMYEVGVELERCRLQRLHPNETSAEIEARVAAWLFERPGAENGDYDDSAESCLDVHDPR